MATELRAVDPLSYYQYFLDKDIRPDNRELLKVRSTAININCIQTADGSALVKLGNTTVICGVKAELTNPTPDKADLGIIVPNVDLPPLCSSRFRPGPPSEQAQVLTQFISDTISNSHCIKAEDLCIESGKLVWCLFIDIICLSYDGNIMDAALLALLGALNTTKLPKVNINAEANDAISVENDATESLKIYSEPFSCTFAMVANGKIILDPTDEEEQIAQGTFTILVNKDELCGIHKFGGASIADEQMKQCIEKSKQRNRELSEMLHQSLQSLQ